MKNFKIKSFCKINLSLRVIKKLNNGYHNIASLISFCDIYDLITISQIKGLKDKITLTPPKEIASTSKINTWLSLLAILKNRNPQMFKEILTLIKAKRMGLKTGGMV